MDVAVDCFLGGYALAGIFLGVAGLMDWLYREIDPELWFPGLILSVPLGFCEALSYDWPGLILMGFGLLLALVVLSMYILFGFIGGADVFAVFLVAFAMPVPLRFLEGFIGVLPPIIVIVFISSIIGLVHKILQFYRAAGRLDPLWRGYEVRVKELLLDERYKWWVPKDANVEEEWTWELASRGPYVVAGPSSPMISHMFLAYLVYIVYWILA